MENYLIFILIWGLISIFINLFGFWINIKIPYYKGKWDKNKKTPIYKLEKYTWENYYGIFRYEIDYDCYFYIIDDIFWIVFSLSFLPFSSWFKFPYYEREDTGYGNFKNLNEIDFDLGEYYERECKKGWDDYNKEIEKENLEKYILNNINKDFNKHYHGTN
jgi:hypothetical protein